MGFSLQKSKDKALEISVFFNVVRNLDVLRCLFQVMYFISQRLKMVEEKSCCVVQ